MLSEPENEKPPHNLVLSQLMIKGTSLDGVLLNTSDFDLELALLDLDEEEEDEEDEEKKEPELEAVEQKPDYSVGLVPYLPGDDAELEAELPTPEDAAIQSFDFKLWYGEPLKDASPDFSEKSKLNEDITYGRTTHHSDW